MSARRVAEHISVLWKGRIVESGPAEELFASENPFVRQFLSGESAGPARHGVAPPRHASLRVASPPPLASLVNASRILAALAGGAARRPRLMIAAAIVLALAARGAGAAAAARPRRRARSCRAPARSTATTQRFYRSFGEEPIEVLVSGDLQQLVLSEDIDRLVGLEGCLSGNVPASALGNEGGPDGPCGQLARARTRQGRVRPGHVRQRGRQPDRRTAGAARPSRRRRRPSRRARGRAPGAAPRAGRISEAQALGRQASEDHDGALSGGPGRRSRCSTG